MNKAPPEEIMDALPLTLRILCVALLKLNVESKILAFSPST